MKEELAIGEQIRIRCVENTQGIEGCLCKCYFLGKEGCKSPYSCSGSKRKDGKNVYFELMED